MKLTMNLSDKLHAQVLALAKQERRTFTAQLEILLESQLKNLADQKTFNESNPTEKKPHESH